MGTSIDDPGRGARTATLARRAKRLPALIGLAFAVCAARPAPVAADSDDLVMSRLATRLVDSTGTLVAVVSQNLEFRELTSQLGTALAPHLLAPADSLGFAGFQFDLDASQTSIDAKQPYWRVLEGTRDPSGMNRVAHNDGFLRTLGLFAHKGILPSFELGVGALHMLDSGIWTAQVYGKLSLHEGEHDSPIPSVAIRGAISRMLNQSQLDLTVASVDLTISKHLGIAGTWRLDPFVGADVLFIIPRSEVLDGTPNVDSLQPGNMLDANNNFVFRDQSIIRRNRLMIGAKAQYNILQLTLEAQYAFSGATTDTLSAGMPACQANSLTANCQATDAAAAQTTISLSAGFDF